MWAACVEGGLGLSEPICASRPPGGHGDGVSTQAWPARGEKNRTTLPTVLLYTKSGPGGGGLCPMAAGGKGESSQAHVPDPLSSSF